MDMLEMSPSSKVTLVTPDVVVAVPSIAPIPVPV